MEYWVKRNLKTQQELSKKSIKDIENQLERYYVKTARRLIDRFEETYDKLLNTIDAGREPTPADLYKLDSYWKMIAETQKELNKLGNFQQDLFIKRFTDAYITIYESMALGSEMAYSTIDKQAAE
jgi:lipopolysaccharide biosynthesis regulator YciM